LIPGLVRLRNDSVHCGQVICTHVHKLRRNQAHHAMHWLCVRDLAMQAGVWLRPTETESTAVLLADVAWEGLNIFMFALSFSGELCHVPGSVCCSHPVSADIRCLSEKNWTLNFWS